jgi:hypothetical protein
MGLDCTVQCDIIRIAMRCSSRCLASQSIAGDLTLGRKAPAVAALDGDALRAACRATAVRGVPAVRAARPVRCIATHCSGCLCVRRLRFRLSAPCACGRVRAIAAGQARRVHAHAAKRSRWIPSTRPLSSRLRISCTTPRRAYPVRCTPDSDPSQQPLADSSEALLPHAGTRPHSASSTLSRRSSTSSRSRTTTSASMR